MDSTRWGNAAFRRLPQIRSAAVKGGGKTYHWVSKSRENVRLSVQRKRHSVIDRRQLGLLDHRQQSLLAAPPWFQQAGEVAAFPQLGNVQLP